jgi:hypothetical protein
MNMKLDITLISIIMVFCYGTAYACTIENAQRTSEGDNTEIVGACSNSGEDISCELGTDEGASCDGPEGSYSGPDLSELINAACGCSPNQPEPQQGTEQWTK